MTFDPSALLDPSNTGAFLWSWIVVLAAFVLVRFAAVVVRYRLTLRRVRQFNERVTRLNEIADEIDREMDENEAATETELASLVARTDETAARTARLRLRVRELKAKAEAGAIPHEEYESAVRELEALQEEAAALERRQDRVLELMRQSKEIRGKIKATRVEAGSLRGGLERYRRDIESIGNTPVFGARR